jgi:2'-5' RNA ligase
MDCPPGRERTLSQFALVAYLEGPLADFLDALRLELMPECKPRAHVTILPPRPVAKDADLKKTIAELSEESRATPPAELRLGKVSVFAETNVIYISIARGERELHALHENLNAGQLEYDGPYPYHPHITIYQNVTQSEPDREHIAKLAQLARERWASYEGPRSFIVDCLTFVQNVAPDAWVDIARLPLAVCAGVCE